MATATASKTYISRPNYKFLPTSPQPLLTTNDTSSMMFELDESEIWNTPSSLSPHPNSPESRTRKSNSRINRPTKNGTTTTGSLPVNVPDWSKILKQEYRENRRYDEDEDEDEEKGDRVPPHEFLARQMARNRIASFSVHEGVGRTLKGRDLSRVRNAIWLKTGFQD